MQRRLMHGRGPAICVMEVSINNEIILVSGEKYQVYDGEFLVFTAARGRCRDYRHLIYV